MCIFDCTEMAPLIPTWFKESGDMCTNNIHTNTGVNK